MIQSEIGAPKLRFNRLGGATIARRFNPRNNRNQSHCAALLLLLGQLHSKTRGTTKTSRTHTNRLLSARILVLVFGFLTLTLFRDGHGINYIILCISCDNGVDVVSFYMGMKTVRVA